MHVYIAIQYFQDKTKIVGLYNTRAAAERRIKRLPKSAWNDHAILKKKVKGVREHGRIICVGQTTHTFYEALDSDSCDKAKHIRAGLLSAKKGPSINKGDFSKYANEEID